jgi:taurine dioxygenase
MVKFGTRELSPAFGTEIEGLDPKVPLDEETRRSLRQLFDDRGLLVFRGLDIDADYQAFLTRMLVGIEGRPGDLLGDGLELPEASMVSNRESEAQGPYGRLLFHSDLTTSPHPPNSLSLYPLELEPPIVPTVFTSAQYAWDHLPDDLRARVADLQAVHGYDETYPYRGYAGDSTVLFPLLAKPELATMPVALHQERSNRTTLYVCQQTTRNIVGLSHEESEALLEELFVRLYEPSLLYRHNWELGDLVVWDNLAVQHARDNVVLEGPVRTFRKVWSSSPVTAPAPAGEKRPTEYAQYSQYAPTGKSAT